MKTATYSTLALVLMAVALPVLSLIAIHAQSHAVAYAATPATPIVTPTPTLAPTPTPKSDQFGLPIPTPSKIKAYPTINPNW